MMRKLFLYFGLLCLGTSALAQQGDPDLILFNGKIFTSVVARPYVEALAIRGERIVAIAARPFRALTMPIIISTSVRPRLTLICTR
jgi:hypothetical protein